MKRTRLLQILAAASAFLTPSVAMACAVCFSGRTDEQRVAFGITTAFMTFLPLLVVGTAAWWLRRRAREVAAEEAAAVAAAPASPAPVRLYSGTSIR